MRPEEYRKLAAIEDRMWYFRALHRRRAAELARRLPPGPARVLDAGCGTGGFIRAMRALHPEWRVAGADLSPLACALARESTGAEIVEAPLHALPFADGRFDAVTTGDVLYHVDDVPAALRDIVRCLRPGGVVVANEPAYRWLWSYHDEATEARRRFTRGELVALFQGAGLEVCFASYANLLVLPLMVVRRKLLPVAAPASDVELRPAPVEAVLAAAAALEQAWLGAGGRLPAGGSVFVAGVKTAR
jgi:ubiquinone/menaquinone biosynthesis C-methylase UbiE